MANIKMVRARAPLRLGLAGGGTDVSPYSEQYGGLVLNATINKYAYTTITPRNDGQVELVAADNRVSWRGQAMPALNQLAGLELHVGVYNRVVKEFHDNRPLPVTIVTHSEAPPGSGLGSSSTIVVSLLQAFAELLSIPLGEYDLAKLAYDVERIDLGMAGGKQDQYAAAFGGFNFMEFYGDRVLVNPLRIKPQHLAELESSLVLFYTGVSRESARIIKEQTKNVEDGKNIALEALHRVKEEAQRTKECILTGNFPGLSASMADAWAAKKQMASSISNAMIDEIYGAALAAGASAGKVSGAGGGGFMMFLTDPTRRPDVFRCLSNFPGQAMNASFVEQGAHAWSFT